LFAVAKIGAVTFEQPDDAPGLHLRRGFVDERPHVAFVSLVWAETLKYFKPTMRFKNPARLACKSKRCFE